MSFPSVSQFVKNIFMPAPTNAARVMLVDSNGDEVTNFGGGGGEVTTIQGSISAPILVTNLSTINIDPLNNEIIYIAGNGGDYPIGWGNFANAKADGKFLEFVQVGNNRVTITASVNQLDMAGDYYMRNKSRIMFRSDGFFMGEDYRNGI